MILKSSSPIYSDAISEVAFSAPVDQLPILAERASRFARLGDLTAARNLISALRARNKDFYPILAGWILLAEAIIDRSEFLSSGAIDC
jgi:hypothetical protein